MSRDEVTRRAAPMQTHPHGYALAVAVAGGGGASPLILTLPDHGEVLLGRDAPAMLIVPDDSVSRRHATIHGGTPPSIEDLGSMNGTKVMGRLLAPGERIELALGTVVEIGTVVAFVQAAATTTTTTTSDHAAKSGDDDNTTRNMTLPPPAPANASTSSSSSSSSASSSSSSSSSKTRAPARPPVARDATMLRLYDLIHVIASSKLSILILGETGVGKDVYAEAVHAGSPRASAPFVRLNCAALPENLLEAELFGYERGAFTGAMQAKPGLFEAADGGTVFLDEIGEMPLITQAKLLRVLESGEVLRIGSVKSKHVDVRFVAATNRDLEVLASMGQFRSDLYFRLHGVSITLPSLRKRPDDLLPLAAYFLERSGAPSTLSPATSAALAAHRWPGNIRELKNVIERAALLAQGAPIAPEHLLFRGTVAGGEAPAPAPRGPLLPLPPETSASTPSSSSSSSASTATIRDEFAGLERTKILETMEKCGGNQSRAAKMLGISRTTLIKRLESYGSTRPRKGQ